MASPPHIVLAGSLAYDRIMVFDGQFEEVIEPTKLHVLSISILIDDLQIRPGGIAGNIAYSLGLLGQESFVLGSVGPDAEGLLSHLTQVGVSTDLVHVAHEPTAVFTAMIDKNGCQVGGFYPGAMKQSESLRLSQVLDHLQAQPEDILCVVSAHDPTGMNRQVAECAQLGMSMVYDVGMQIINMPPNDLQKGIDAASLLIVNDYEMSMLAKRTNQTEDEIISQVPLTVVTLGAKGCRIVDTRSGLVDVLEVPAVTLQSTQVIDPTGAGDAFRAGFLYGYVRGWPLEQAARLGCVTASFAVESAGGQEHTFTKATVADRFFGTYQTPLSWE